MLHSHQIIFKWFQTVGSNGCHTQFFAVRSDRIQENNACLQKDGYGQSGANYLWCERSITVLISVPKVCLYSSGSRNFVGGQKKIKDKPSRLVAIFCMTIFYRPWGGIYHNAWKQKNTYSSGSGGCPPPGL